MMALRRILVPYDFSETSAAAVGYAAELARKFDAQLAFLYVGDRVRDALDKEIAVDANGADTDAVRSTVLKALSQVDRDELKPQVYVRAGVLAAEIVAFATENDIDLIVMGTHGRGFVGHMVMGSVAEKIVRTAPCPVLTVRRSRAQAHGAEVVAKAAVAARAV